MSVFELLHAVQDVRTRLADLGVSLDQLLWVALAAAVVAALTLREILGWYLKLNEVRRDLREIKAMLAAPPVPAAPPRPSEPAVPLDFQGPERL